MNSVSWVLDAAEAPVARRALLSVPSSRIDPVCHVVAMEGTTVLRRTHRVASDVVRLEVVICGHEVQIRADGLDTDMLRAIGDGLTGLSDRERQVVPRHDAVTLALRRHPSLRLAATAAPYEETLAAVIGQRITAKEAARQWRDLCRDLGEDAGFHGLCVAPQPMRLAETPYHRLHALGIERKRAETISAVGRFFATNRSLDEVRRLLLEPGSGDQSAVRGVGQWTRAVVSARAFADPDALAVGDWHVKNLVAHALAGKPRGTDAEMLALLEPYAGQRQRVVRLLAADGWGAPRLGHPRRILDIADL